LELGLQPSVVLTDTDLNNIREDSRFKQILQRFNKE